MSSFFDEIARNRMKSLLLLVLFSLLFIGIIFLFTLLLGGGLLGIMVAVVLVVIYGIVVYATGDKFVLKFSGAKEADRTKYRDLYSIVEGLAAASQLPAPRVYIIEDQNPNAFATGKSRKNAYIAVTTGLLAMMEKRELQGVIAHELSHVADNDIQYMMIAVVFAGAIGIIAAFIRASLFFGGFGMGGGGGRNNNGAIILLIALVIGIIAPLLALLIRLAISRRREYMADANGARITRDPHSLAGALKKIESYSKSPQSKPVTHANEVTAPLYFANPFRAKSLANLLSTHPPIEDRIDRLEHMY